MTERNAIWIAILRPHDGDIIVTSVMSLREIAAHNAYTALRTRYNDDMRVLTMRLPPGTRRAQVYEAFTLLSIDERRKLYQLPRHRMG
jgi:hypothetical protein